MRIYTGIRDTIDPEMFKKRAKRAAHVVAAQALRDMTPMVPFRSGKLRDSGHSDGRKVSWTASYAGVVNHGTVMVDPKTKLGGIPMPNYGPNVIRSRRNVDKINSGRLMHFAAGQSKWIRDAQARFAASWLQIARKELLKDE